MAVSLIQITSPMKEILNVAPATYGTNDDLKRYKNEFIDACALSADEDICKLLATSGHTDGLGFVTDLPATTTQLSVIPVNAGIVAVKIDGVAARKPHRYTAQDIARLRSNPTALTRIGKLYVIENGVISFTGTSCVVTVVKFTKTSAPQIPDGYLNMAIARALQIAFPKAGLNLGAAAHFGSIYQMGVQQILQGKTVDIPPVQYPEG